MTFATLSIGPGGGTEEAQGLYTETLQITEGKTAVQTTAGRPECCVETILPVSAFPFSFLAGRQRTADFVRGLVP